MKTDRRPALDTLELAMRILRAAPARHLLAYYIGSVPGVLGFLYFITEMGHGALARKNLPLYALAMALLYLWAKAWHTVAMRGWADWLGALEPTPWTAQRLWRMISAQAALQPLGLFFRPIAAAVLVPYAWTYQAFQNLSITADGEHHDGFIALWRDAWGRAFQCTAAANYGLALLKGAAFYILLNSAVAILIVPQILKMFFAIETHSTLAANSLLNTTTVSCALGLTYLIADPARKALAVLLYFEASTRENGKDLRVELKKLRLTAATAVLLLLALFAPVGHAQNIAPTGPPPAAPITGTNPDTTTLDRSLDDVLRRREFTWRMPRELAESEKGWLATQIEYLLKSIADFLRDGIRWIGDIFDKIFNQGSSDDESHHGESSSTGFSSVTKILLYAILGLLLIILIRLGWKTWRARQPLIATAEPATKPVDLNAEDISAADLPEDEWLKLARELSAAGDLRLATRALYLAGLSHLGTRNLISIARYKSNRDYERELRRRARGQDTVVSAFDDNLTAFERIWYGSHAMTPDGFTSFGQKLEEIRRC